MNRKEKTAKQLERHFKGVANHRRIDILVLIAKNEGITLEGIAQVLNCNIKTVSEHTRRLVQAGLVNKKYQGRMVTHTLSPYLMVRSSTASLGHSNILACPPQEEECENVVVVGKG